MKDASGGIAGTITKIEPTTIEKAPRTNRRAFDGFLLENYFIPGVAAGIVEVGADAGAVDCSAGFGASCFWHPAKAKTAATASTAMIALIFFMLIHPPSSHESNCSALFAIR